MPLLHSPLKAPFVSRSCGSLSLSLYRVTVSSPVCRRYARRLSELSLEAEIVSPFDITMEVDEEAGESGATGGFLVKVDAGAKLGCVCVGHDRLVSVAIDGEAGCAGLGGSSGERERDQRGTAEQLA